MAVDTSLIAMLIAEEWFIYQPTFLHTEISEGWCCR
jgi:hypothetical protein